MMVKFDKDLCDVIIIIATTWYSPDEIFRLKNHHHKLTVRGYTMGIQRFGINHVIQMSLIVKSLSL